MDLVTCRLKTLLYSLRSTDSFNAWQPNYGECNLPCIVVKVQLNGIMTWKLVPNAGRALNVKDEGVWPRVIDICG